MKSLKIMAAAAVSLLPGVGLAVSEQVERVPEALGYWTGNSSFTTEPMEMSGPISITLGAWCHDGVGFVRVAVLDLDGREVATVVVFNQGVEHVVVNTVPGDYRLQVTVSHFHVYVWELQAVAVGAQPAGGVEEPVVRQMARALVRNVQVEARGSQL